MPPARRIDQLLVADACQHHRFGLHSACRPLLIAFLKKALAAATSRRALSLKSASDRPDPQPCRDIPIARETSHTSRRLAMIDPWDAEAIPTFDKLWGIALHPAHDGRVRRDRPRSAIISTRSRRLSLKRRYHLPHKTMISRSKWRPSDSSSKLMNLAIALPLTHGRADG